MLDKNKSRRARPAIKPQQFCKTPQYTAARAQTEDSRITPRAFSLKEASLYPRKGTASRLTVQIRTAMDAYFALRDQCNPRGDSAHAIGAVFFFMD